MKLIFPSVLVTFLCCVTLKPLGHVSGKKPGPCSVDDTRSLSMVVLSEEIKLLEGQNEKTKGLLLKTDVRFITSTLTVYTDTNLTYTWVVHLMGTFDHNPQAYKIDLYTESQHFDLARFDTFESAAIGEILDEHLLKKLTFDQFEQLAHAKNLRGTMGEYGFTIPYECREEWRTLLDRNSNPAH